MTRFARHKKEKKPIGEDATPWKEMKESSPVNEKDKRREEKRLEKKRKRQLKQVRFFSLHLLFEQLLLRSFRSVFAVELPDIP